MKCLADECKRQCFKGKCNYIGQSQSKAALVKDRVLGFLIAFVSLLRT